MTNSPSNARFSWQKSRWTGSASVSGRMQGATGYAWRMPAENSTRETQPPETCGHRGWIDVSAARPVSTSQQTGDGDVKPHQPSVVLQLRMMEVVMTTGAVSRAKLQSNHHHQQNNIRLFTCRMPFLSPNQQCQSTEHFSYNEAKR